MQNIYDDGGKVALAFLEAIKNEDAKTFWTLLDRRGQGYFLGMWFYVLQGIDVGTVEKLTGEGEFLQDALGSIIGNLKDNLGDTVNSPELGPLEYTDEYHAVVPILNEGLGEGGESIPLIMELIPRVPGEQAGPAMNLTGWKIDTLNCVSIRG